MTQAGKEGIGNKPEDIFSGQFGEIMHGIAGAIRSTGSEYQDELALEGVLIRRILERKKSLQNNTLGILYEDFQRDSTRQAWGRFVREYQKAKAASPDEKVEFRVNPDRILVDLPTLMPHDWGSDLLPVPDEIRTKKSIELSTNFGRILGILEENEEWIDFVNQPDIKPIKTNDYDGAKKAYEENPNIIQRMDHGTDLIEFPITPSKKYPGVIANVKFFPAKYKDTTPVEQLIKEGKMKTFIFFMVPRDLFLKSF